MLLFVEISYQQKQSEIQTCPGDILDISSLDIYEPVCGYGKGYEQGKTFKNYQLACLDKNFMYYKMKECENKDIYTDDDMILQSSQDNTEEFSEYEEMIQCKPEQKQAKVCTDEFIETCGVSSEGFVQDFSNPCQACIQENIEVYFMGVCDEIEQDTFDIYFAEEEWQECPNELKNSEFCDEYYIQTCGKTRTGEQIEFTNECDACRVSNIEFFKLGECDYEKQQQQEFSSQLESESQQNNWEEEQMLNEFNIKKCEDILEKNTECDDIYEPVCAFTENGEQQFPSSCLACIDENVEYFLDQPC